MALTQGLGSPLFAACCAFSAIVMYDAMGVRRHAGYHAEVLNKLIDEVVTGLPVQPSEPIRLKEVLGHTPRQVLVGGLLGVAVAMLWPYAPAALR